LLTELNIPIMYVIVFGRGLVGRSVVKNVVLSIMMEPVIAVDCHKGCGAKTSVAAVFEHWARLFMSA
jgi:hypothetical protein